MVRLMKRVYVRERPVEIDSVGIRRADADESAARERRQFLEEMPWIGDVLDDILKQNRVVPFAQDGAVVERGRIRVVAVDVAISFPPQVLHERAASAPIIEDPMGPLESGATQSGSEPIVGEDAQPVEPPLV